MVAVIHSLDNCWVQMKVWQAKRNKVKWDHELCQEEYFFQCATKSHSVTMHFKMKAHRFYLIVLYECRMMKTLYRMFASD